jgi:hypothetical protein
MSSLTFPTLSIESTVGDLRVVESRSAGVYVAQSEGGERSLLVALTDAEAAQADALARCLHDHLAKLGAVRESNGGRFVVTEALEGTSLRATLASAPEGTDSAENVRTLLRIADVVAHLHADGLWHGRVSAESMLVTVDGGAERETPVLTFAPAPAAPYLSPERSVEASGSADDDTWAVAQVVLEVLTGKTAPTEGLAAEEELIELGVQEEPLRAALFVALGKSSKARRDGLKLLRRALARHFVHQADEDSVPAGVHSSAPPPLPSIGAPGVPSEDFPSPSIAPTESKRAPSPSAPLSVEPSLRTKTERRRMPLIAGVGLVVGLGVAWAAKAPLSSKSAASEVPKAQVAQPAPSASGGGQESAIQINDVAVTGEQESATGNTLATCVAGYLPKGAFEKPRDLGWVCKETDPVKGSAELQKNVSAGSDAVKSLTAMGPLAPVAFAVVQKGCCDGSSALASADARCAALGPALSAAGKAVIDGEAVEPALTAAAAAVSCAGGPAPTEPEQKALRAYTDSIRR